MSTKIIAENGAELEVCSLGIAVVNHEEETETWVRLSQEQRRALADALDPERAQNQRAEFHRERDAAVARAEKAEAERDEARRWLRDTEELLDAEKARVRGLEADDDPVVYVIRESEIAAVEVTRDRFGFWCSDGDPWVKVGVPAEVARGDQAGRMRAVARHEAVARAIEAVEADRDTAAARACEAAGLTCDEWDELPGQARDMLVQAWREGLAS